MALDRRTLLLIFLVALTLRGAFVATRGNDVAFPDSIEYDHLARSLLAGNGYQEQSSRQASRAPGYPVFLAGCYALGLDSPRQVYAIQAIADAAMCMLVALLGRRLFGESAGVVAGLLAACYPYFIFFCGLLLAESLFTLALVGYILLLARLKDRLAAGERGLALAAAAGLTAGALVHLRSSFLLMPLFLLPFLLWRRQGRARMAGAWAVSMALMGLVMLPWIVRNYRVFERFVPATLQVGESLYEANSPHADGGPAMDRIDWVAERGGVEMGEYDNNEYYKRAAVRWMREHPGRMAALAVEKFKRFWNPLPNYGPYRRPLYAAVSLLAGVPLLILAAVGALRRRGSAFGLLIGPVLYYTLMHMIFVGSVRYRIPVMPFVVLLAAAGAMHLRDWCARPVEAFHG